MASNQCIGCDSRNSSRNLINIQSYSEKFSFVTGIKDLKSYSICESCNDELQISYNFKRRVLDIYRNSRSKNNSEKDLYFNDVERIFFSGYSDVKEESDEFENKVVNIKQERVDIKEESIDSDTNALDSSYMKNDDDDSETNDYMDILIPETCLDDGTTDCNDLKPNSCKFCYVEFDNEEEKNEHEVVHQNESQPYRCPQTSCKSRFKTKNYLKDHFRVHTNERPYSCRFCEIAFKSTSNRSRHEKKSHPREYQIKKLQEIEKGITPKGKQPVEKEVAGNSDETEEQPESNRKVSKRGNKEYSCRFCDKTFRRCDNWRRHEAIHSDDRPYKCECEKTFKTRDMLRSHQKTHFKVFECEFDECDKKFDSFNALEAHKRIHTGERPFNCPEPDCDRTYTSKKGLREHQRRQHILGLRFECDICGKKFNTNGHLISHRRYHTNERNYVCDFEDCNKACFSQNQLKIHKRYHTGERPYSCDECEKSFFESKSLKIHKRHHSGKRPFKCHFCTSVFVARSILRRHLMRLHGCSEITPGINFDPDDLD